MATQLRLPHTRRPRRHAGGRPPRGPRSSERHETRPRLRPSEPVHVTIRVAPAVHSLRRRRAYAAIREALITTFARESFRVVHVSIQRTHVHLLVEATDRLALARGMQGFQISAARHLNAAAHRRGTVFPDRYHSQIIRTPRHARHALAYVLNNWRRHREHLAPFARAWRVDPFSTAVLFDGWRELAASPTLFRPPPTYDPLPVYRPKTWLLTEGWRRYRLISHTETPAISPASQPTSST